MLGGVLDHRRLSYFLAVAAERSFTRASERLHIAQPALSRQVRLLEDEVGGPLLIRGSGADGVTTTEAGRLLVERAPALLLELERLERAVADAAGGPRRSSTLKLGYAASAAHGSAPPILNELRARSPEIEIDAHMLCNADAMRLLHAGELDAAILRAPEGTDGLATHLVRRELQGVVLAEDHRLAGAPTVPLAALDGTTIVIHPRIANPGRYDAIVAACKAAGIEPDLSQPLLAFDPTHAMVRGTDRVTIVSDPGGALPPGLVWRPMSPVFALDVRLVTPLIPAGPVVDLLQAASVVAEASGWLREPVVVDTSAELTA